MGYHFWFNNPSGSLTEITNRIQPKNIHLTSNAEEMSVGVGTVLIDDPNGDFNITGHRIFYMDEDEASGPQHAFTGYVFDHAYYRYPPEVGAGRQIEVQLVDENSVAERRVLTASGANRPAETDVARMQWLAGNDPGNFIDDTSFLDTSNPVNMDAVDYRGQYVNDVIRDCMDASGKNAFIFDVQSGASSRLGLWYGASGLTTFTSSCSISTYLSDVQASPTTCFPPSHDAKLTRSPSRVYSGVYMPYDGGFVYRTNATTAANFAIGGRDTIAPAVNVKTSAKATARADRYLTTTDTEEDTITCYVIVPLAKINQFRAGMSISCAFQHFVEYAVPTTMRILNRTVTCESETQYRIDLTLSPGTLTAAAAACSTTVATMQSFSTGYIDCGAPGCTTSWTFATMTPSTTPSTVVTIGAMLNSFENPATQTVSVGAPWTNAGNYAVNGGHVTMQAAYRHIASGGSGNEVISFNNRYFALGALGIALPTSASTPVQSAQDDTAGGNVILGATPTAGNILVLLRDFQVLGAGFSTRAAPAGFTQVIALGIWDTGLSHVAIDICVRCVASGDGTTWNVGGPDPAGNKILQEWALT